MSVKQVLKPYVRSVQSGGRGAARASDADLSDGLSAVSHTSQLYFQLCFAALLLLFSGSCVLVIKFLNDPSRLGALFAITGVSIVCLIAQMVVLWKQKVTADIVALLASGLKPADVRGVIEVLFARL